jgi:DNA mismatch repair protein MutL
MSIVASIKALPPSTVHHIGSSQVLVDSCSVVKELIDNAVDARATSISIEISPNTLDVIQVTDNGHGITPEDRAMVCRRYTTSKISDFSDLIKLGGTSLGFRGEALHSLANLSGSLTVTTRVDSEIAAVKLLIARTGEVEGCAEPCP